MRYDIFKVSRVLRAHHATFSGNYRLECAQDTMYKPINFPMLIEFHRLVIQDSSSFYID